MVIRLESATDAQIMEYFGANDIYKLSETEKFGELVKSLEKEIGEYAGYYYGENENLMIVGKKSTVAFDISDGKLERKGHYIHNESVDDVIPGDVTKPINGVNDALSPTYSMTYADKQYVRRVNQAPAAVKPGSRAIPQKPVKGKSKFQNVLDKEISKTRTESLKNAFPDFGELDVKIPDGFADVSWHNDTMPSFEKVIGDKRIKIFVDYADKEKSEVQQERFFVIVEKSDDPGEISEEFGSDDWNEILKKVKELETKTEGRKHMGVIKLVTKMEDRIPVDWHSVAKQVKEDALGEIFVTVSDSFGGVPAMIVELDNGISLHFTAEEKPEVTVYKNSEVISIDDLDSDISDFNIADASVKVIEKYQDEGSQKENKNFMILVATQNGYDFYIGEDGGKTIYNIVKAGSPAPTGGYPNKNYITRMKGVSFPEERKAIIKLNTESEHAGEFNKDRIQGFLNNLASHEITIKTKDGMGFVATRKTAFLDDDHIEIGEVTIPYADIVDVETGKKGPGLDPKMFGEGTNSRKSPNPSNDDTGDDLNLVPEYMATDDSDVPEELVPESDRKEGFRFKIKNSKGSNLYVWNGGKAVKMEAKGDKVASIDNNFEDDFEADMAYDDFQAAADDLIESKGYGLYKVVGKNMGWRSRSGEKELNIQGWSDIIEGVLPKTSDMNIEMFDGDENSFSLRVSHHDAPTGETYEFTKIDAEDREEEKKFKTPRDLYTIKGLVGVFSDSGCTLEYPGYMNWSNVSYNGKTGNLGMDLETNGMLSWSLIDDNGMEIDSGSNSDITIDTKFEIIVAAIKNILEKYDILVDDHTEESRMENKGKQKWAVYSSNLGGYIAMDFDSEEEAIGAMKVLKKQSPREQMSVMLQEMEESRCESIQFPGYVEVAGLKYKYKNLADRDYWIKNDLRDRNGRYDAIKAMRKFAPYTMMERIIIGSGKVLVPNENILTDENPQDDSSDELIKIEEFYPENINFVQDGFTFDFNAFIPERWFDHIADKLGEIGWSFIVAREEGLLDKAVGFIKNKTFKTARGSQAAAEADDEKDAYVNAIDSLVKKEFGGDYKKLIKIMKSFGELAIRDEKNKAVLYPTQRTHLYSASKDSLMKFLKRYPSVVGWNNEAGKSRQKSRKEEYSVGFGGVHYPESIVVEGKTYYREDVLGKEVLSTIVRNIKEHFVDDGKGKLMPTRKMTGYFVNKGSLLTNMINALNKAGLTMASTAREFRDVLETFVSDKEKITNK